MISFFNKYKKIDRKQVAERIVSYQTEIDETEKDILAASGEIKKLYALGAKEKDPQMRSILANKIMRSKRDIDTKMKRIKFLDYDVQVMEKLKQAIDDREFTKGKKNDPINKLLSRSKDLDDFLSQSAASRASLEGSLVNANNAFESVNEAFPGEEDIYDTKSEEKDIMAQFERSEDFADEAEPSPAVESSQEDEPKQTEEKKENE
jgi:hypothetical protein